MNENTPFITIYHSNNVPCCIISRGIATLIFADYSASISNLKGLCRMIKVPGIGKALLEVDIYHHQE